MPRKITAEMLRKMLIKLPQNRGKNVFQTFRGKKEHITCKKNELAKDFYFLLSSNTLMSGKKKRKKGLQSNVFEILKKECTKYF